MKTLYISDLDGTLLNRQSKLSSFTRRTLEELIERGVLFTYATARSIHSASSVLENLAVRCPVIVYNGVRVVEPDTGKPLVSNCFLAEEAAFLRSFCEEYQLTPLVYSFLQGEEKVSWLQQPVLPEGMQFYLDSRKGDKRLRPVLSKQELYCGEIFYVTCIGEKEALQPAYEALEKTCRFNSLFGQDLYRTEYWLEVMHRKANKASAVAKLKQMLGCDRIVCFGDGKNDIPLFQIADECYAVENAVTALKRMATGIIESNDSDGVAKWLLENAV